MPVTVDGVTATSALDTWVDLGCVLDLDDLVALGDPMLSDRLSDDDVIAFVEQSSGIPGVGRAREAPLLIRPGSVSAWESKARVAFVHAGLPDPELNVDIFDADDRWLARPDFVWRQQRVVGEYDGDQHRTDRRAWQYERERRARLEDAGWTYVEMTSLSLSSRPHRVALFQRLTRLLL